MELNSLIYYEFKNIDYYISYFKDLGIFNLISSRSYRSEIINKKKKLQLNVIINFINNENFYYNDVLMTDVILKILKMYSNYLFLYELLKKGD